MMMFWYGGHWAWWQGGLMWLGMIVFWGLLIWAAYAVITNLTRKPGAPGSGDDAQRILDQRLRDLIGSDSRHAATGVGGGQ